eukprot:TRINITY_DN1041_c0_g1_i1.p1 TRINITY_DN1041_c0_g1~~TRINITY_DN1041_c0_g1_i1.p1  ORF type:complete len:101 (+),score=29.05 TRINITY_DN1041_c0_g1_i1:235-537(+)
MIKRRFGRRMGAKNSCNENIPLITQPVFKKGNEKGFWKRVREGSKSRRGFEVYVTWQKRIRNNLSQLNNTDLKKALRKEWEMMSVQEKLAYEDLEDMITL